MTKRLTPPLEVRGIMLDPARQTERHEFYFDLLPQLAAWGYNTLWWHFCDDEGFSIKLQSHPELATPYAFSRAETRRFIRAAAEVGIRVVPEVETLGHARAITRLPQYAHLTNGSPMGHNAICPSEPETLPLMNDLITEVAELFGGPYLHVGLDEARLVGCETCARRNEGKPRSWVFLQHALAIHKMVNAQGKRMIMWADPVEKNPELLDELPRDIILAHWHYGNIPEERILPSIRKGFQIICVPAHSGRCSLVSGYENPAGMVDLALRLGPKHVLGTVSCWWEPARVLRDTYPMATAFVGEAMKKGKAPKLNNFARRFVRDYFGCDEPALARALRRLTDHLPGVDTFKCMYPDTPSDIHMALVLADGPDMQEKADRTQEALETLIANRNSVTRHQDEFGAYLLSARVLSGGYQNLYTMQRAYRAYKEASDDHDSMWTTESLGSLDRACTEIKALTAAVALLTRDVDAEWNRTRYPRDTKKDNSSPYRMRRSQLALLPNLMQSERFLNNLLRAFQSALRNYSKGGGFPGTY